MKYNLKDRISSLLQKYEHLHQNTQDCPNDMQTFIDDFTAVYT